MRTCGTDLMLFLFGLAWVRVTDVLSSESCPLPVFSPSTLVVKHGDPAFASCSVCNGSCESELRLEEPLSSSSCSGSSCIWNVTHIPLWSFQLICYIFDSSCQQSSLKVTVYQPPERVSLSFEERPLLEGELYSLHCEVEAVAPARLLTVTFYRNHRELGFQSGQSPLESPVNQSLSLDYTVSREDHGAHFYCVARLELGPRGPQPPPVVWSQNINANVLYAPHSAVSEPQLLSVVQGQSFELNCSSEGNPTPHYSWIGPSHSHTLFSGSVFTVHSATSEHEGQYSCNASNSMGSVQRIFTVTVTVNYVLILVAVVVAALILASVVASLVYLQFYRHSRTGHYSLRDVFRLHRHNAVPTAE